MQTKSKNCKGTNLAKGYGCNKEVFKRTFGLCDSCLYDFYTTSENGKIIFEKRKLKVKKANDKKVKTELKEKIKTLSDYAKELQKEINTIVRLIDKGTQCISTLKPLNNKFDAGHFYSVGSNPALRFHLDNIHAQSVYANQYLSGDQVNYINGLSKVYGENYKNYVLSLKSRYKTLKLSKDDYKEKILIAKDIVRVLKLIDDDDNQNYSVNSRIKLREEFNEILGIYEI